MILYKSAIKLQHGGKHAQADAPNFISDYFGTTAHYMNRFFNTAGAAMTGLIPGTENSLWTLTPGTRTRYPMAIYKAATTDDNLKNIHKSKQAGYSEIKDAATNSAGWVAASAASPIISKVIGVAPTYIKSFSKRAEPTVKLVIPGEKPGIYNDIHDIRLAYHNNTKILSTDELAHLQANGYGNPAYYKKGNAYTRDVIGNIGRPRNTGTKSGATTEIKSNNIAEQSVHKEHPMASAYKYKYELHPIDTGYARTFESRRADKWSDDWFKNPITVEKARRYGLNKNGAAALEESLQRPVIANHSDVYNTDGSSAGGLYNPITGETVVSTKAPIGTGVHERAHATKFVLDPHNSSLPKLGDDLADVVDFNPAETYAELQKGRFYYGVKPGEKLNPEQFDDLLSMIRGGYNIPLHITDKEGLRQIFNKMPAVTGTATGLSWLSNIINNEE